MDPATQKRLAREVTLGPPEPGRERTIALLASQLLLTSWAESFLARTAPAPTAPKDATPSPSRSAVTSEASSDEPRPPATSWEVALAAGLRLREWESPVYDPRIVLRPSVGVGRFHLLLDLAV